MAQAVDAPDVPALSRRPAERRDGGPPDLGRPRQHRPGRPRAVASRRPSASIRFWTASARSGCAWAKARSRCNARGTTSRRSSRPSASARTSAATCARRGRRSRCRPAVRAWSGANWWPVPDLLSSTEFQHHFVADVDDVGRAVLRFGDGEYGERLIDVDQADVWYRIGNGRAGNIGADSLAHIVRAVPASARHGRSSSASATRCPRRGA